MLDFYGSHVSYMFTTHHASCGTLWPIILTYLKPTFGLFTGGMPCRQLSGLFTSVWEVGFCWKMFWT